MKFTPCCDWDILSSVYKIQATDCDNVMAIGPPDYDNFTPELEIVGLGQSTPIYDHESNQNRLDETDVRKEAPPEMLADGIKNSGSSPLVLDLTHDEADTSVQINGNDDTKDKSVAKIPASSPVVLDLVHDEEGTNIEISGDANTNTSNPSVTEAQPGSKACADTPSKPQPETEHIKIQTTPAVEKEDDDEIQITDVRPSSAQKRKLSVTPVGVPAKKRTKLDDVANSEQEGETAPAVKATCVQTIESDSSEEESDSDDEESEDPRAAEKLAIAKRHFAKACKNCRADANRALKYTYDSQISRLKREHRDERHDIKERGDQKLRDSKKLANGVLRDIKSKHEKLIETLKSTQAKKLKELKARLETKHEAEIETWQEKHDDDKEKIKKLTNERDAAIADGKEIEKNARAQVRDAVNDLQAGKLKLKEEKKQMIREKQEEIDQLKPAHSKLVKEKASTIKDMTEQIVDLEEHLKQSDEALREFQTENFANKQRHEYCKDELAQTQRQVSEANEGLHKFTKYASSVEKRASSEVARFKDRLELSQANLREQSERVITQQRENYRLKDSVQELALLGREKRDEVEKLKAELKATRAELGLDIAGALDSLEET